jgi:hypothetical protein
VNDEGFVLRITLADKRESRGVQPLFARLNAATVIDDQAEADGNIFVLEDRNTLLRLVLIYPEMFFFQVSDRTVLLIGNIDVDFGEIHVNVQFEHGILPLQQRCHEAENQQ